MNILALDRSGLYFGSAYNLIQWAERLISDGHVVSLGLAEQGEFKEVAERVGIKTDVVPMPKSLNKYGKSNLNLFKIPFLLLSYLVLNYRFLKFYDFCKYDLVVANNYRTYVYLFIVFLVLRIMGVKTILRYQTSDTPLPFFKRISIFVFWRIIIHGTPGYSRTMFGSRFVQRVNVFSLPNPVDTNKFFPQDIKDEIRMELGIPVDALVFISVSYIEPRKGVYELVKVFGELSLKNAYLVHIGDSGEHREYEHKVKSIAKGNVTFLGRRNDVDRLLNAADCFILYSEYEGMPYVIVEAMAVGLHVIASDAGSNEEVLSNIGDVVKWGRDNDLKTAITNFYSVDSYDKGKIIEKVSKEYSEKSYFSKMYKVYGIGNEYSSCG